ncbi:hypothetical protein DICPUDRAFT_155763 [Dictyostelium purpureum]|uniref:OTU domain-containing protein n=1 Tax=Dictyostelium purpureum TaxID=5786 RepID=F0ZUT9_DICPU|nr:uncharacterized protein DICPUDRAFT_155763 [Dictyostelium purpureum]EGC32306.1 hypothetical protein DICPUDRAFT_155763 [Dictyostelium purpureum]|eukprot:XP_003291184.1 hypothetical protein DICPUDRAFT_155763 [Dictyostelium purpureum]
MYEFLNLCVYLFFVGTICWKLPSFIGKFRFKNTKRNNIEKDDCQCWNSEDKYWASQVLQQQEQIIQIQQTQLYEPQEFFQHLQSLKKPQLFHLYQEEEHPQQPQQPQQNQEQGHQKLISMQPKEPEKPQQLQPQQSQQPIPPRPIPFIQLIRQQPQHQQPQQSQPPIPFIQRISHQSQPQQPQQSQQPKHPQQSQQPIPPRTIPFIQLIRQQPQHQQPQQPQPPIPFIQRISQQPQPQKPQQSQQPKQSHQPIPQQPIPQQPIPQQPTPFIERIRQQPQPQQPQQSQQPIPFIERIRQQLQPQPTQQPLTQNAPIKPNEIDLSLVNSNGKLSLDPTPLNETEKAYIRLNERIELYQLMPKKEIPGDGNCQMHALSDQIFGDLEHSVIIRNNIVDWLRQNKGFYLPNGETLSEFVTTNSWEEYCDSMSKNGTWGDHLTLVAAAEIYKKNISIISSVESQSSSFIEITPSIKCENGILLSHFAEFHYGSLCTLAN